MWPFLRVYGWLPAVAVVEVEVPREIDPGIDSGSIHATVDTDIRGLLALENEILKVQLPLSYADEPYDLHLHIEWVLRRLERVRASRSVPGTAGLTESSPS
ncbi:MAG: hypothetical protein KJ072_19910 [Verrucomicrobia bacterium]|nr:hypothetical protein [Verrucomicrobiota bacterium]